MGRMSWEIARGEKDYPRALEDLGESAPKVLYGVGDRECLNMPCISIIGARKATPYGQEVAEMAARVAVECDLVVVSGGAMGCDHAASRSAIDSGGRTIIVSGAGADVVYPDTSRDIFHDAVRNGGAVISISPWKSHPQRFTFVRRNAIIAAMSRSLFVTEAGLKSGTMSTAEVANQLGRNIYAIPGSIFSPNSQGTNSLIATGASIIASEMDLQTQISLDYDTLRMVVENHYESNSAVISALIASPMRADELSERLGQALLTTMTTLSEYETQGLVVHLLDGRYSVTQTAYEKYFRRARQRQGLDDPYAVPLGAPSLSGLQAHRPEAPGPAAQGDVPLEQGDVLPGTASANAEGRADPPYARAATMGSLDKHPSEMPDAGGAPDDGGQRAVAPGAAGEACAPDDAVQGWSMPEGEAYPEPVVHGEGDEFAGGHSMMSADDEENAGV
ncbi:MAG: DNA-processing protein DprA [Atopobiaceae bacterium]